MNHVNIINIIHSALSFSWNLIASTNIHIQNMVVNIQVNVINSITYNHVTTYVLPFTAISCMKFLDH
jgi:hypothetical protein